MSIIAYYSLGLFPKCFLDLVQSRGNAEPLRMEIKIGGKVEQREDMGGETRLDNFLKMMWKGNFCLDTTAIIMNLRVQSEKFFSLYIVQC